MKNLSKYILLGILLSFPVISFGALTGVKGLIKDFGEIVASIFPIMYGICLIYFFYGVGQFILNDSSKEEARKEGKQKIIWGIVALFVVFSIMGIISAISGLTGIETNVKNGTVSNNTTRHFVEE